MEEYKDPEVLRELYWKEELSLGKIAKEFGVVKSLIQYYMERYSIERRPFRKFIEIKPVEPSKELAYWLGAVQTDGHFAKKKEQSWRIEFGVADKSLPMLEKFKDLTKFIFGLDGKITQRRGYWWSQITVTKYVETFETLGIDFSDPPKPPEWCKSSLDLFGAYLAGVIDGDGSIKIRKGKPVCLIRIASGKIQSSLKEAIKDLLHCGVCITSRYDIRGQSHLLEFSVSKKTRDFIEKFVLPELAVRHKNQRLLEFLSNN